VSQVLPVELPKQANPVDYIFEQPPANAGSLLPRYVEMEIYRALLESPRPSTPRA
jgi:F-type H+-transporting ATPase subunit gamma